MLDKAIISINTLRVKLKSSIKARELLKQQGYITQDGVIYKRVEGLSTTEEANETEVEVISHQPNNNRPVLVTSYLIGSHVNQKAWAALTAHAKHINAEIVVIAHRYSNPTVIHESLRNVDNGKFIDPLVRDYLAWEDFTVHNHLVAASVRINPTNINPLPTARRFCTGHTVIGHSIQAMDVKATTVGQMPSVIWTTGTISNIDKADNLTATVAQFHYKFGWIVITNGGSSRNVHATKDGKFTDLLYHWDGERSSVANYPAVVWGDYHHGLTCQQTKQWAIKITRQLKPTNLVLHDFIDASTVNPHASVYERSLRFDGSLEKELFSCSNELVELYKAVKPEFICLVRSNHNDMISRYLNSKSVSEMTRGEQLVLARWLLAEKCPETLVKDWSNEIGTVPTEILDEKSSFPGLPHLGLHGDAGSNGSKGSIAQYFSLSFRGVIGHSHSPGMLGAVNQVGTLTSLRVGYNDRGLSDWLNSIVSVNQYGKCQHLIKFFQVT